MSLTPLTNIQSWLSPRIFEKICNCITASGSGFYQLLAASKKRRKSPNPPKVLEPPANQISNKGAPFSQGARPYHPPSQNEHALSQKGRTPFGEGAPLLGEGAPLWERACSFWLGGWQRAQPLLKRAHPFRRGRAPFEEGTPLWGRALSKGAPFPIVTQWAKNLEWMKK